MRIRIQFESQCQHHDEKLWWKRHFAHEQQKYDRIISWNHHQTATAGLDTETEAATKPWLLAAWLSCVQCWPSFPSVMQEIAHILNNTQTANRNCFPTISLYMYSENKGLFYFILKAVLLSNVKWAAPIQKSLPVLRSHDHPWSLLWSKMNKCYKDLIVFLLHWDMWLWSV